MCLSTKKGAKILGVLKELHKPSGIYTNPGLDLCLRRRCILKKIRADGSDAGGIIQAAKQWPVQQAEIP